jgi:PHD/YefM family antitoxin component YafN of YafNO toxin-antitoxin module
VVGQLGQNLWQEEAEERFQDQEAQEGLTAHTANVKSPHAPVTQLDRVTDF